MICTHNSSPPPLPPTNTQHTFEMHMQILIVHSEICIYLLYCYNNRGFWIRKLLMRSISSQLANMCLVILKHGEEKKTLNMHLNVQFKAIPDSFQFIDKFFFDCHIVCSTKHNKHWFTQIHCTNTYGRWWSMKEQRMRDGNPNEL